MGIFDRFFGKGKKKQGEVPGEKGIKEPANDAGPVDANSVGANPIGGAAGGKETKAIDDAGSIDKAIKLIQDNPYMKFTYDNELLGGIRKAQQQIIVNQQLIIDSVTVKDPKRGDVGLADYLVSGSLLNDIKKAQAPSEPLPPSEIATTTAAATERASGLEEKLRETREEIESIRAENESKLTELMNMKNEEVERAASEKEGELTGLRETIEGLEQRLGEMEGQAPETRQAIEEEPMEVEKPGIEPEIETKFEKDTEQLGAIQEEEPLKLGKRGIELEEEAKRLKALREEEQKRREERIVQEKLKRQKTKGKKTSAKALKMGKTALELEKENKRLKAIEKEEQKLEAERIKSAKLRAKKLGIKEIKIKAGKKAIDAKKETERLKAIEEETRQREEETRKAEARAKKPSAVKAEKPIKKEVPIEAPQEIEKAKDMAVTGKSPGETEEEKRGLMDKMKGILGAGVKGIPSIIKPGEIFRRTAKFDTFVEGNFSFKHPQWPPDINISEDVILSVSSGPFGVELSAKELYPLTFGGYVEKITALIKSQLKAEIVVQKIGVDNAYMEFEFKQGSSSWLYKAKVVECNKKFYTVAIKGLKKEFYRIENIAAEVLNSIKCLR